jgi:hypothetical protein
VLKRSRQVGMSFGVGWTRERWVSSWERAVSKVVVLVGGSVCWGLGVSAMVGGCKRYLPPRRLSIAYFPYVGGRMIYLFQRVYSLILCGMHAGGLAG